MGKYNNGIPYFEVEFESFKKLLGLKAPNVSKLKGNYLNKAIKEINDKTIFTITMCKGRKEKGVNYIRFEFEVDEIPEMTIEEQITYSKKESIARERLEKAKGFEKIRNEEAWLKKTISSITDEELEKLENMKKSKELLDEVDLSIFNDDLYNLYGDWVKLENYRLVSLFDDTNVLTNNAIETLEVLRGFDDE
jgi:plasmid replication initiation protein